MIDPSGVLKQDLKGYGGNVPRIFILNPKRTAASSISNAVSFDQFRPSWGARQEPISAAQKSVPMNDSPDFLTVAHVLSKYSWRAKF
jgi:hypothetical protein